MHICSVDSDDRKYPTPNNWCDLLVKYIEADEITFTCKSARDSGNTNRCHFAINPNCKPDSPSDTVLLFETKGGWNVLGRDLT